MVMKLYRWTFPNTVITMVGDFKTAQESAKQPVDAILNQWQAKDTGREALRFLNRKTQSANDNPDPKPRR